MTLFGQDEKYIKIKAVCRWLLKGRAEGTPAEPRCICKTRRSCIPEGPVLAYVLLGPRESSRGPSQRVKDTVFAYFFDFKPNLSPGTYLYLPQRPAPIQWKLLL